MQTCNSKIEITPEHVALPKMKRDGNVEILRCVLMFMIVLWHYLEYLSPTGTTASRWLMYAFICWHVDCFVAISGWWGIKFTWKKFFKIYGAIFFYCFVNLILGIVLHKSISIDSFVVNGGWFGNTYLGLMLCAPFLNEGIEALARKSLHVIWQIWGLLALVVVLSWAPYSFLTSVDPGGMGAYTLANMVFVYVTVRLVRITELDKKIKPFHVIAAVVFFVTMIAVLGGMRNLLAIIKGGKFEWSRIMWLTGYDAPYVWIMAIAMLVLFVRYIRLPEIVKTVACFVAPSCFSIYLLHHIHRWFINPHLNFCEGSLKPIFGDGVMFWLMAAASAYVLAFLIDLIRRLILTGVSYLYTKVRIR